MTFKHKQIIYQNRESGQLGCRKCIVTKPGEDYIQGIAYMNLTGKENGEKKCPECKKNSLVTKLSRRERKTANRRWKQMYVGKEELVSIQITKIITNKDVKRKKEKTSSIFRTRETPLRKAFRNKTMEIQEKGEKSEIVEKQESQYEGVKGASKNQEQQYEAEEDLYAQVLQDLEEIEKEREAREENVESLPNQQRTIKENEMKIIGFKNNVTQEEAVEHIFRDIENECECYRQMQAEERKINEIENMKRNGYLWTDDEILGILQTLEDELRNTERKQEVEREELIIEIVKQEG